MVTKPVDLDIGNRVKYMRRVLSPQIKFPPIGSVGRVILIDYQPKYTDYKIEWDDGRHCYCDRREIRKLPNKKEGT